MLLLFSKAGLTVQSMAKMIFEAAEKLRTSVFFFWSYSDLSREEK